MSFEVGNLVRHIRHYRDVLLDDGVAIVLEVQTGDYAQLKVATAEGITYWWPAVTEVVDESR
jgi:hypothetical protein